MNIESMKPFESGRWQAWAGTSHIILSDTNGSYELGYFKTIDDAINWLYVIVEDKPAARALNAHKKECNL